MKKLNKSYHILYYCILSLFIVGSFVFWWILLQSIFQYKNPTLSSNKFYQNEQLQDLFNNRPKIEEEFIIIDDTQHRTIVSNLVNIALIGKNLSIIDFANDLKVKYPSNEYSITYLDSTLNRLQVKLPSQEREVFKRELKYKLPNQKLLVWDETLFQQGRIYSNDPLLSDNKFNWYLNYIQIQNAWSQNFGSNKIKIAVLDNGFDLTHPELENKDVNAYNVISRNTNVLPSKENHGTHVSATIVGKRNNQNGLMGICPECSYMPIKVEDSNGYISSSYIIDGILYAIKNNADIVNISLSGMFNFPLNITIEQQRDYMQNFAKDEEEFWNELFQYGVEEKTICVLSAGNNQLLTGLDPFSRTEYAIKVGAVDMSGNIAKFSNFGTKTTLYAPGVNILSAKPSNQYEILEGTSMAAPIVSGFIGLILSENENLSFLEVMDILYQNTEIINENRLLKIKTLEKI